jgi:hypothetical protein
LNGFATRPMVDAYSDEANAATYNNRSVESARVKEIGVLHVFCHSLKQRRWLVERHGQRHLGHILSDHGLEDTLSNVSIS